MFDGYLSTHRIFSALGLQEISSDICPGLRCHEFIHMFWYISCSSLGEFGLNGNCVANGDVFCRLLILTLRVHAIKTCWILLKFNYLNWKRDNARYLCKKRIYMTRSLCGQSCLIDLSDIDDIVVIMQGREHIIKIDYTINFDLMFDILAGGASLSEIIKESRNYIEKCIIMRVLEYTDGNKAKSARILQINYKTLYYKIKKYCLESKKREVNHRASVLHLHFGIHPSNDRP